MLVVVTALLAVAMVGTALMFPSSAADPDTSADRVITVDAVGEADAEPDQAVVTVAATAEGDDPAAVRDELAANAEALRGNLEAAGLDSDDYETIEYRLGEPHRPPREGGEDGPAYRGVHAFEVTVEPDAAGDVVDAAADAGAEVGTVEFTLSAERREELRSAAIDDAMADARLQADDIAASADLSVTSVAGVEASQRGYSPVRREVAAAGDAAGRPRTAVETGPVTVSYEVQVAYNATRT